MKMLGKKTMALCLFSGYLLVSCSEKPAENTGTAAGTGQSGAAAGQQAQGDSIHYFSSDDFQDSEGESLAPVTLEALDNPDLRVAVRSTANYSAENKVYAEAAARRLEIILNSQAFHTMVLSQTYAPRWNRGLSPEQIYERLMQGKEPDRFNVEDGVVDLQLQQRDGCKGITIGYRNPGYATIHTYQCYLDRERATRADADLVLAELAGHYIHEHLHVLGFGHSYKNPEKQSVPYRIGNVVRRLGESEIIVGGRVTADLAFKTNNIVLGESKKFKVYQSHYGARVLEPLALNAYRNRSVTLRFMMFDDKAIYGASIN